MRYLVLFTPDAPGRDTDPAAMEQMDQLTAASLASGLLVATGGLGGDPLRVRRDGARVTIVDGPFTEAKEVVAGFALVDVASPDEALAMARQFLAIAGDGTAVMHEVFDDVCGTPTAPTPPQGTRS